MADPSQAPDLIGQLLAGGGNTAQIVMAVVIWRLRDDLRDIKAKVERHDKLLTRWKFKGRQ